MDNQINIDQSVPTGGINIDAGLSAPYLTPETADTRATKARFGMIGLMPEKSKQEWYSDIISGQEDTARKEAASNVDMSNLQRRIISMVNTGAYLPGEAPVDPTSVFETQFTNKYLSPLVDQNNRFTNSSEMKDAVDKLPDVVSNALKRGQDWGSRGQYIQTQLENLESEKKKQGWYGTAQNFALGAIPGAYSVAMRMPALRYQGFGAAFGSLGPDFQSMNESLMALPTFEEFKERVDTVLKELGPNLGYQWLSQVYDQTASEKMANAAFDALDLSMVAPALRPLATRTVGAVKSTVTVMNQVRKLAPEVVSAAARGDLKEAAHAQIVNTLEEAREAAANPKNTVFPQKLATNSLLDTFRVDEELRHAGPSSFGQDIMNRIDQRVGDFVSDLERKIETTMRVNRTPYVMAREDVVRAEQDRIRGQFRGLENAIVDIKGPFYEEVSPGGAGKLTNTHWHEVRLGTYDGELWASESQARLFAEFHGFVVNRKPFGHEPLNGMNKAPIEYSNYTEFRDAARRAGLKPQDLKKANISSSMAWQKAKESQVPLKGYDVKNDGNGWYISIPKTWVEDTDHTIANLSVEGDARVASPFTWANKVFKWSYVRQPPDTLAPAGMAERRVAAHGPSEFKKILDPINKVMLSVPREYRDRFSQFLEHGQEMYDKNGKKGYFFESPQDMEDWYQNNYGTRPSAFEVEAYFAGWKPMANFDLALRNGLVYRNQAINGAELYQIHALDKNGKKAPSEWFSAMPREEFPNGEHAIMVLGDNQGEEKIMSAAEYVNTKAGKEAREKWKKGEIKAIEVYDPRQRPLRGWGSKTGDKRVRYVLGKNIINRPLDVGTMVPQRGGGHVAWDYDWWGAQADMRYDEATDTWWNEGDKKIMPFESPGEAKDVMGKMEVIRQYMQASMYDEAKTLMKELPIPVQKHMGFYQAGIQNGKRIPPMLSVHSPLRVVGNHQSIAGMSDELSQLYGPKYRDGTKTGGAAAKFEVEFTGERDADEMFTITAKGTKANPLYEYKPAPRASAIPVAWRATQRAIKSFYNDDLKLQAMKTWLKEAQPLLNKSEDEIWHAPWWNFNKPDWRPDADPLIKGAMEANRLKIQQFSGIKSDLQSWMFTATSKLSESLYGYLGPRANIVPLHRIPLMRDPYRAIRSLVVHRSLGLFNVPQLAVQGSTAGNILAFAGPKHALPGIGAAILDRWTRFNRSPEFLKTLDKILSNMAPDIDNGFWRTGEFLEAQEKLSQNGFANVDSEHPYSVDPDSARTVRSKFGTFLHWGMWPFREMAEFVRTASYYTAYHEFRHGGGGSKPGRTPFTQLLGPDSSQKRWGDGISGPMSREHESEVLNRAGWHDHNMSRAATSAVQQGAMSIPMLFVSYRLRLTEALFGRELNPVEKARLLGFSMFLYGIPAGPLGLVGVPLGDYLRKWAIDNGYRVGGNFATDIMMEGVVGTALAFITGAAQSNQSLAGMAWDKGEDVASWMKRVKTSLGKMYEQGTHYNIGERVGNEGLASAIGRDSGIIEMLGGAPYGTYSDATWRFSPMMADIMHPYSHPFKAVDILDAANVLNGVANISRTITAFTTHEQLSKSGLKLTPLEVSKFGAIFQGITGFSDVRTANAYVTKRMTRELEENQLAGQRLANEQLTIYFRARQSDPRSESDKDFIDRAFHQFIISGNAEKDWPQFFRKSEDNFGKNIVDTTMDTFWRKQGDDKKRETLFNVYRDQIKSEENRGEK